MDFDYNRIPHNMGNDGKVIHTMQSEGVWVLPDSVQQQLGTTVNTTSTRNTPFYDTLLNPLFAASGRVDVSASRKRGSAAFDVSKNLPFDLVFTYMRELKSGFREEGGGGIYSQVNTVMEVPGALNEVTQDLSVRANYNFDKGSVHASFARNLYDNRAETLTVDNPFIWFDTPYLGSASPTTGGGSRARWVNAPDNEASTGNIGFQLKFAKQTRVSGDLSMGWWTQNAAFYPYTINSAILTPTGARADQLSTLQRPSFDGKIDTTTINLVASSRPLENLGLRASFRSYDLTNKTNRFVLTGGVSENPDRDWVVYSPSAENPYGTPTANVYDHKTTRFTASATYDFGDLTLEGLARFASLERTSRESPGGDDNGFALTAIYHFRDWVDFRGTWDQAKRTADGETLYGFHSDEAERETTSVSLQADFTLPKNFEVSLAYSLRDVKYPNRPDRIAVSNGAPSAGATPIPGTPSGLLDAKYDSFTVDLGYIREKLSLGAYYTYEKDRTTNQWSTTSGVALNNQLNYKGSDKADTFGANAQIQLKPEVWTLSLTAMRQKVDGLMDITAREAGAFYTPGRTTLIAPGQGGAADILDWDDTSLTTVTAELNYHVASNWTLAAGYWYEKYDFKDAYQSGALQMPQSIIIALKSNDGPYDVNVAYAKVSYRF
jgi:hypothetical protein